MIDTPTARARTAAPRFRVQLAVIAVLGCGMAVALLQRGLLLAVSEQAGAFWPQLAFDVRIWLIWLVLSPAIVAMARALPFRRTPVADAFWHLLAALTLSAIHTAVLGLTVGAARAAGSGQAVVPVMLGLLSWRLAINAFVYGTVVALTLALDSAAHAQARELAASKAEVESTRARLLALQMQIQPHFVFNTLNTAAMLARPSAPAAADVITRLSELLRELVADSAEACVPLRNEFAFVERYLGIERARFGERLRVTIGATEEALQVPVPRLLLQPIVENAVQHGLSRSPTSGAISISAVVESGWLTLRVTDDGPGPQARNGHRGEGLGLTNTRSRLVTLYGDACGLELSGSDEGAVTTIRLPAARGLS